MNNRIIDLTNITYKAANLPEHVTIKGHDVHSELLLVNHILNPVVFLVANQLYIKGFSTSLIKLDGALKRNEKAPFGLEIEGDLSLSSLKEPLGVVIAYYSLAFKLLTPLILNDGLESIAKYWSDKVFTDSSDGDSINLELLSEKPLLTVLYSTSF